MQSVCEHFVYEMFVGYLLESEEMERGREHRGDAMRSFHVAQPGWAVVPQMWPACLANRAAVANPERVEAMCNQNAAGKRLSVNEARDQSSIGPAFSCA
jgi:hypothetical protein